MNSGISMGDAPYPEGIDCVWLASDHSGHLGVFVTGGVGPIPIPALNYKQIPVEHIEGLVCDMPSVSATRLLVPIKRPDDFIDLAERGVFVYDWSDVHRTEHSSLRAYELIAVPIMPITVALLPENLAPVARLLKFRDVVFADRQLLDVRLHMTCRESK